MFVFYIYKWIGKTELSGIDKIREDRKEWVGNDIAMVFHCQSNVASMLTYEIKMIEVVV